ncbi:hypothetical protein IMZ48_11515 [Candidatus Bathyarchaeota archaeon]|nr:hypothetical protein [Candidatus Bathyarchaeota archaeon]
MCISDACETGGVLHEMAIKSVEHHRSSSPSGCGRVPPRYNVFVGADSGGPAGFVSPPPTTPAAPPNRACAQPIPAPPIPHPGLPILPIV